MKACNAETPGGKASGSTLLVQHSRSASIYNTIFHGIYVLWTAELFNCNLIKISDFDGYDEKKVVRPHMV
jgi:hypothetical protein